MSLQTSRNSFFFLFFLTLFSCQDPNDIGLNLQTGKNLGTSFTNKQPIEVATLLHPDSILAFKNSPIAVGKVSDGEFGIIEASHYAEVMLNGNNVLSNIGPGAQADSLVLVLAYNGYYYGDTTQTITLNVHRLTDALNKDNVYFTNTQPTGTLDLLGTITFKPKFNRVTRNGRSISRLIRIPLSQAFANELLGKSGSPEFSSQDIFRDYWKGIAITPAPSSNAGSVVGFNTIPDSAGVVQPRLAGINLYFKNQNGSRNYHNFALNGTLYYNGTQINRQGSPLTALDQPNKTLPATQTADQAYIQTNTGVKTFLTFPELEKFEERHGEVFVNHAELIIPVKRGTGGGGRVFAAPGAVYFYEATKNNRVLKTGGGVHIAIQRGDAPAAGIGRPARATFNADSSFYKADITSYIQAVVDLKKPNNGIIVTATPEDLVTAQGANVSFPETSGLNRAIITTSGRHPVQLRIYYSQLK